MRRTVFGNFPAEAGHGPRGGKNRSFSRLISIVALGRFQLALNAGYAREEIIIFGGNRYA
jgi:hypothetical protein